MTHSPRRLAVSPSRAHPRPRLPLRARRLTQGVNPAEKRTDGTTALMLAEEYGRLDAARRLRAALPARAVEPDEDPFRYPDPKAAKRPASAARRNKQATAGGR